MSKLISNIGTFSGGYFVLNKAKESSVFSGDNGFSVTCKDNLGLLRDLTDLIVGSHSYIKICSFIIDNRHIFDQLIKKLHEGKVAVFILTAVDERNIKSNLLNEDEATLFSSHRHFEFIGELVKAGAHIRASSSAHAKFVIADGERAMIMSANLTEPSLSKNQKEKYPNDESGILFSNAFDVNALEKLFDSIFQYGTQFKKFVNFSRELQLIDIKEIDISAEDFPDTNSNTLWTYEQLHHLLYSKVLDQIEQSRFEIKLSTYSIVALENLSELKERLKAFIDKGGKVKIFSRAMNHRGDHIEGCYQLSKLGAEIYGDMFNHSKGISSDGKRGIIFTANIDGRHGLKSGFEVGYALDSSNASFVSFDAFLTYQLKCAPYVFKRKPNKQEVFEFYQFWYSDKEIKGIPFPSKFELKYHRNKQFVREFESGIGSDPIFFSLVNLEQRDFQFKIRERFYLVREINAVTFEVRNEIDRRDIYKGEEYLLFYESINLTEI